MSATTPDGVSDTPPAQTAQTQAFLTQPPLPLLLKLASPNVLAFLVQATVSIAEVYFVGQLGTVSLAAIALVFPWLMLMQMMANGAMGGAVTSAVARAVGSGDQNTAERLIWNALAVAALAGALFIVLGQSFASPLLRGMTEETAVYAEALQYARIIFAGCPVLWLMALLTACFRGTGNMRFPATLMIIGSLLQIPLSGALILGWFGLPSFGIAGAAISILVISAGSSALLLAAMLRPGSKLQLSMANAAWRPDLMARILRVGLPSILSPVFTVATISGVNYLVADFGIAALAGYGIGSRIEFLLIPMVFGIGVALNALVGINLGAGQIDRAHRIGWTGAGCAAALTGGIGTLLAIWPEVWAAPFTDNAETLAAAVRYLEICGVAFLFQGIGMVLYFGSQGAGRVGWPIVATALRFAFAVGLSALAVHGFGLGLDYIYASIAVGMVVYGAVTAGALRLGMWR